MKFLSLEHFVSSRSNFEGSKQLFQVLGFTIKWDAGDYVGFERDNCKFILRKYENIEFAKKFMISVRINNTDEFRKYVIEKKITGKFSIKISSQTYQQPIMN